MAAEGFYGGDPEAVMRAPADWVVKTMQYLAMKGDFEDSFMELNREQRG